MNAQPSLPSSSTRCCVESEWRLMSKPLIAITMGDPAGVGPEICLQLLANEEVCGLVTPVVFGDARLLSRCARQETAYCSLRAQPARG